MIDHEAHVYSRPGANALNGVVGQTKLCVIDPSTRYQARNQCAYMALVISGASTQDVSDTTDTSPLTIAFGSIACTGRMHATSVCQSKP